MYWRRRLTRLEAGLYAAVVGILIAVFIERALYYMELAERATMEATIARLNSAIQLRIAHEVLRGTIQNPSSAHIGNPFEFASAIPPNFQGGPVAEIEAGRWGFDGRNLVYRPRLHRFLTTSRETSPWARFRLAPSHNMLVPTNDWSWELT